jgi:hypothetical protein
LELTAGGGVVFVEDEGQVKLLSDSQYLSMLGMDDDDTAE